MMARKSDCSPLCDGDHRACKTCGQPLGCLQAGSCGVRPSDCTNSLFARYTRAQHSRGVRESRLSANYKAAKELYGAAEPGTQAFARFVAEVETQEERLQRHIARKR